LILSKLSRRSRPLEKAGPTALELLVKEGK
jgi:hypothetical protein